MKKEVEHLQHTISHHRTWLCPLACAQHCTHKCTLCHELTCSCHPHIPSYSDERTHVHRFHPNPVPCNPFCTLAGSPPHAIALLYKLPDLLQNIHSDRQFCSFSPSLCHYNSLQSPQVRCGCQKGRSRRALACIHSEHTYWTCHCKWSLWPCLCIPLRTTNPTR